MKVGAQRVREYGRDWKEGNGGGSGQNTFACIKFSNKKGYYKRKVTWHITTLGNKKKELWSIIFDLN